MADNLNPDQRSAAMRKVKSKDTSPELAVRQILKRMGFMGYRLHRRDVPGNPDIAWLAKRRAIFIHGCFWHGHDCRRGSRKAKTNRHYWRLKIHGNARRDAMSQVALKKAGWRVLTIWECELRDIGKLNRKIARFLCPDRK